MTRRAAAHALRRLCRVLLLPLLLLCVQQGAFLHELSHYQPEQSQDEHAPQGANGLCSLCLAFAGVQGVADASPPRLTMLAGLSFALMAVAATLAHATTPPSQRNRGPPHHR